MMNSRSLLPNEVFHNLMSWSGLESVPEATLNTIRCTAFNVQHFAPFLNRWRNQFAERDMTFSVAELEDSSVCTL
jgi:hypothetical protein